MSHELPDVQIRFRKGRGTRDQIANIRWIVEKQESPRKTSMFALLTMPKSLTVWITINWKILQEIGMPDHLTYLLRNLYAGQEATVRTGHGTTYQFQIGKEIHQSCILSLCLFNLYAEFILRNAGLDEAKAGIKNTGRNINNARYADNTTLMAESEGELKSLFMKVKEEGEKVASKLNIQKTKIMASGPITSWQIDGETVETMADFIFLGSKITADLWCWRRLLRVPWTAKRSNQSILKKISPECSLEGLMLKVKLLNFGHLMRRADSFEKTLMLGKIEGERRRG